MTVPVRRKGCSHADFSFSCGIITIDVQGDVARRDDWESMAQWCSDMAELSMPRRMTWADLGLPKPGAMRPGDIGLEIKSHE